MLSGSGYFVVPGPNVPGFFFVIRSLSTAKDSFPHVVARPVAVHDPGQGYSPHHFLTSNVIETLCVVDMREAALASTAAMLLSERERGDHYVRRTCAATA